MEDQNIYIDPLKWLYMEVKKTLASEQDMLAYDRTDLFWKAVKRKIQKGESVNVGIRGEVTTGKSTVAIAGADKTNKLLRLEGHNAEATVKGHIFSDQIEYLRFINSNEHYISIVIDEFNRMGETGLNATTESALFEYHSDVFAQRYIHKWSCNPSIVADKNTTYILDVIGKNIKKGVTCCKLIYRDVITNGMGTLGYVNIDVNHVMKQEYYQAYRRKKFRRMELIEEHGVRDIRELEFANIIIETLQELQDLAKIGKVSHEIAIVIVDETIRRNKRIYSILTKNEIATKVKGILGIYTEINKLTRKKMKCKVPGDLYIIEQTIAQLQVILEKRQSEQNKLQNLYNEYLGITGKENATNPEIQV